MIYGTVGLGKICFTVLDAEEETFREGGFLSPVERDIKRHAEVCQLEHVLQGSQEERQDSLARQQHPTLHPGTNNNNNFAVNDGSVNYDENFIRGQWCWCWSSGQQMCVYYSNNTILKLVLIYCRLKRAWRWCHKGVLSYAMQK